MWMIYGFWYYFFEKLIDAPERYKNKEWAGNTGKHQWIQQWASNTHHVVLMTWTFYNFGTSKVCGDYSYAFMDLYDTECFQIIDKRMVYCGLMISSYMCYDLCVNLFLRKIHTLHDKIIVVHHIASISGTVAALYGGFGFIKIGQLFCLLEFNNIPLNYRTMLIKQEMP